jgi:diguanylate cyclase (GGDEF)-like protein
MPYPVPASPPPVVLTSIEGTSQEFQPGDHPVLAHTQDSLSIRFSALNYASETSARFRYRLLGSTAKWNDTRERSVHFEGLPGGRYVFEVIAAGPDGLWSPVPAQFAFTVKPPWWLTWWFITTSLLTAGFLAALVWRSRVRALVSQQELLKQQVAAQTAELRESHRQLKELAYCDTLTSLPNRRMFTEQFPSRLAQARRQGTPFALLLVDLDNFKRINDTFGHDAGDAVLFETAARLRVAVRESDCVARLGGDEFAILLITANHEVAIEAVCNRIVDSVSEGIPFKDIELHTGCSIGIAMFPHDGDTQEGLYKSADLALYEAKRTARNGFCWYHPGIAHGSASEISNGSHSSQAGLAI